MTQWLATVSTLVALAASTVLAQTNQDQAQFDIEAGPMYGIQDPERTVTPGWGIAGTFDLGGQTIVVEGAWHRRVSIYERYDVFFGWEDDDAFGEAVPIDGLVRHTSRSRYALVTAGLRGGGRQARRLGLYYQVLVGGFWARFRTDYEYPEAWDVELANSACDSSLGTAEVYINGVLVDSCGYPPYPAFDEQRAAGLVVQPGAGIDVGVWRQVGMRFGADFPIFASPDYVVTRPRLTARVVVGFGASGRP